MNEYFLMIYPEGEVEIYTDNTLVNTLDKLDYTRAIKYLLDSGIKHTVRSV